MTATAAERDAMRRALDARAERPARVEPAGRRRDPLAGRRGARRGLAPRRRHRARRGRRAVEARARRRARRDGGRDPRALQPHRPHRPVRGGAHRGRASRASSTPSPIPAPQSSGGGARLRAAGVDVEAGVLADEGDDAARVVAHVQRLGRPHVTVKWAQSLDGRAAASDGTSQWITGARGARRRAPPPRRGRRDRRRHRHGARRRPRAHRARRRRLAARRTSPFPS